MQDNGYGFFCDIESPDYIYVVSNTSPYKFRLKGTSARASQQLPPTPPPPPPIKHSSFFTRIKNEHICVVSFGMTMLILG